MLLFSGVLSQLGLLEVQARSRRAQPQQQPSHVKELKVKVEQLILQRDQLRAEIQAHQVRSVQHRGYYLSGVHSKKRHHSVSHKMLRDYGGWISVPSSRAEVSKSIHSI